MLDLLKLAWDAVVLRDSCRKGEMTGKVWAAAIAYPVAIYAIALPATLLYQNHPEKKPVFIGALTLVGLITVIYFVLAIRWHVRLRRDRNSSAD